MPKWIDLLDPDRETLERALPTPVHADAIRQLLAPIVHDDEPRPKLEGRRTYIFGVFVIPRCVDEEDRVYFQEIDLVVTHDVAVTVRKTPEGGEPFSLELPEEGRPGEIGALIVDEVAEAFLTAVDTLDNEVDQVDDAVEDIDPAVARRRIRALRQDLLRVRRVISPTREAMHRVVDKRVDLEGAEAFPHDIEVAFGDAYDKLLRAIDGLDLARELLAGARDYSQAKIANDQNEVMKRLTAVASLLLLPTFIVGVYGQNFQHHFPELHWRWGYLWSWALILVTTIAQLMYFRRKRWI